MKKISKSKLKPVMLKVFREIEQTGEELVITDHGRPVLKVIPYKTEKKDTLDELRGTVIRYDDPFEPVDRIIVATARVMNMKILTKDDRILDYKHVKSVWE